MGWFLVTIVVPLAAPFAFLWVFRRLPLPQATTDQVKYLMPIKDGQLCWAAMGFCVAGLYEIAEPSGNGSGLGHGLGQWVSGTFIALLVFSAMLAGGGAVFPTPLKVPANVKWHRHFSAMLSSLVMTAVAATSYAVVHFQLTGY